MADGVPPRGIPARVPWCALFPPRYPRVAYRSTMGDQPLSAPPRPPRRFEATPRLRGSLTQPDTAIRRYPQPDMATGHLQPRKARRQRRPRPQGRRRWLSRSACSCWRFRRRRPASVCWAQSAEGVAGATETANMAAAGVTAAATAAATAAEAVMAAVG